MKSTSSLSRLAVDTTLSLTPILTNTESTAEPIPAMPQASLTLHQT